MATAKTKARMARAERQRRKWLIGKSAQSMEKVMKTDDQIM
jgi:hypothetical protein